MGSMNGQGMVDQVRLALDQRQDFPAATLLTWVNMAYLHICQPSVYRHNELLSDAAPVALVTGTSNYAAPSGIIAIHSVKVTQPAPQTYYKWLDWRSPRVIERTFHTDYNGTPAYWTHGPGAIVKIRPAPDATWNAGTLTVRSWIEPTLLTLATTTVLQSIWDEVLIMGAIWRGWRFLNRFDRAEVAKVDFGQMVNEVNLALRTEAEDNAEMSVRFESPMQ